MVAILNAGMEMQITLKTPNAIGAVTLSTSGNVTTITLTIDPAGLYFGRAWLAEQNASPAIPSTVLPDVSGVVEWDIYTDANGQAVFHVEHTGAHIWDFRYAILGYINDGGEIEHT